MGGATVVLAGDFVNLYLSSQKQHVLMKSVSAQDVQALETCSKAPTQHYTRVHKFDYHCAGLFANELLWLGNGEIPEDDSGHIKNAIRPYCQDSPSVTR
jgi:hypothetical protein